MVKKVFWKIADYEVLFWNTYWKMWLFSPDWQKKCKVCFFMWTVDSINHDWTLSATDLSAVQILYLFPLKKVVLWNTLANKEVKNTWLLNIVCYVWCSTHLPDSEKETGGATHETKIIVWTIHPVSCQ